MENQTQSSPPIASHDLLAVLAPVLDWYQSDEHPEREPLDILRDIVADLQSDRADSIALGKVRAAIGEIVCTEGEDAGVVYLSNEAPTDWNEKLGCAVYRHECFSPLGDALVALHRISSANDDVDARGKWKLEFKQERCPALHLTPC